MYALNTNGRSHFLCVPQKGTAPRCHQPGVDVALVWHHESEYVTGWSSLGRVVGLNGVAAAVFGTIGGSPEEQGNQKETGNHDRIKQNPAGAANAPRAKAHRASFGRQSHDAKQTFRMKVGGGLKICFSASGPRQRRPPRCLAPPSSAGEPSVLPLRA